MTVVPFPSPVVQSLPYYLTGTAHWLTEDKANELACQRAPAIVVDGKDGTWSVWYLSETPRRTGQPLVRKPSCPHKLYKE